MKKFFTIRHDTVPADLALLIVRLVAGYGMMLHGWGKIQNPFAWAGDSFPAILQGLAALAEFGGGLALLLGFLTRLSALGIFFTMLVAAWTHAIVRGDPFVSKGGASYEPAAMYLIITLLIMIMGAGRYSIDAKIFGAKRS